MLKVFCVVFMTVCSSMTWASIDGTDTSNTNTNTTNAQNQQKDAQERSKLTQKVIKALTKTNYKKWSSQQNFDGGLSQEEGKLFGGDDYDNTGDN